MKNIKLKLLFTILSVTAFASTYAQTNPALHFDGVDDYVSLGPNAGNNLRTIEFWLKLDAPVDATLSTEMIVVCREVQDPNVNEWHFSFTAAGTSNPAGTMRFVIVTGVGQVAQVYSDNDSWNANQWYHIAGVIDASQGMMLFVDGIKQGATAPGHTTATVNSSEDTELGRQVGFSRYYQGTLDDVRFSDAALYTSNFTPPCPDNIASASTVGNWNMNEGSGTIVSDNSSNTYDGTIFGPIWTISDNCVNAISEIEDEMTDFYVYPNPNTGQFKVSFDFSKSNGINLIEFYSATGQKVRSYSNVDSSTEFNLTDLQDGLYQFVFFTEEGNRITGKVSILH